MAKHVEIILDEPLIGHGEPVKVVHVREPRAGDLMDIGDPLLLVRTESDALVSMENDDRIRAYVDRLLFDAEGKRISANLIATGSMSDMIRIREAVLGFFTDARIRASSKQSA